MLGRGDRTTLFVRCRLARSLAVPTQSGQNENVCGSELHVSILGTRVLRAAEDPRFLTGGDRYIDNIDVDGAAHVVYVTSTVAHARIAGIDTAEARSMPGVVGVYTAADVGLPVKRVDIAARARVDGAAVARHRHSSIRRRAGRRGCGRRAPLRSTRPRQSSSTTSPCRRSSVSTRRCATARRCSFPRPARTSHCTRPSVVATKSLTVVRSWCANGW